MSQTHTSPIKTPRQLIAVVVVSFIAPILVIALLAALVTSGQKGAQADDKLVLERIRPVGTVVLAGTAAVQPAVVAAAPATSAPKADGKSVYDASCLACHATGAADAPKLGDKAAWAPRLKSGHAALVASVIKGKGAMPPKAGNPALSDDQIKAAVDYMLAAVR